MYSSKSGSGPIEALGARSAVELRTVPEWLRIDALGVTAESDEGAVSVGTDEEGTDVAPSLVTVALDEPQLVHGAVVAAGRA